MSSKLRQKKNVKTNSGGTSSAGGRVQMTEKQKQKNRRLMILSILAILAGVIMSFNQSVNNEYAGACTWQETARTDAAALKTASEDLLNSQKTGTIADSGAVKAFKEASERISDDAGIPELYTAVLDLKEAVSLVTEEAERSSVDLASEIKTVSDAAEKTEKALVAANEAAKAFNEMCTKLPHKLFAETMGLSMMETW